MQINKVKDGSTHYLKNINLDITNLWILQISEVLVTVYTRTGAHDFTKKQDHHTKYKSSAS
jgi:hypothetical protein